MTCGSGPLSGRIFSENDVRYKGFFSVQEDDSSGFVERSFLETLIKEGVAYGIKSLDTHGYATGPEG